MAKNDKFKKMQQGGVAMSSFQELASTVAAIEKQATPTVQPLQPAEISTDGTHKTTSNTNNSYERSIEKGATTTEAQRYMRLPNPQIPVSEYNLVSAYCNSFNNMTRLDFVEMAIIEKLHNDELLTNDEYKARYQEIKTRPPRGQRKGTKLNK